MKYIYDLIIREQQAFYLPIQITDQFSWNFPDHVAKTVNYKNSIFHKNNSGNKPFKAILPPILNLQYRASGFDVKDITLFINNSYKYFKSFLVKKFHEKWARENGLDTVIDNSVESYVDFGGALLKKKKPIPEVVPLQRLAFCDQSDILNGPICEKHPYSPDELRTEAQGKGWDNVEEAILLSEENKEVGKHEKKVKTPGKYIQVFELHGMFPRYCLSKDNYQEFYPKDSPELELVRQVHICVLYKTLKGEEDGITLFKGPEKESPYKFCKRTPEIYGRALGRGGAEELFQDQTWVNYGMIRMKQLLDAASKVLFKTTDPSFANRNKTDNLESGEVLVLDEGKDIGQLDTTPKSTQLFDNFIKELEEHARVVGSSTGALLGEHQRGIGRQSYNAQALVVSQGQALHDYRKGKLSTFWDEVYRDWILPEIVEEMLSGHEFLVELDLNDFQAVSDGAAQCAVNDLIKESVLNEVMLTPELLAIAKDMAKEKFVKGGNKKFMEILKNEFKGVSISVKIDIAGKQKDLAKFSEVLRGLFQQIFSTYNPQTGKFAAFEDPRIAKLLNQGIEAAGLSPIDFYVPRSQQPQQPQQPQLPQPQLPQRPPITNQPNGNNSGY